MQKFTKKQKPSCLGASRSKLLLASWPLWSSGASYWSDDFFCLFFVLSCFSCGFQNMASCPPRLLGIWNSFLCVCVFFVNFEGFQLPQAPQRHRMSGTWPHLITLGVATPPLCTHGARMMGLDGILIVLKQACAPSKSRGGWAPPPPFAKRCSQNEFWERFVELKARLHTGNSPPICRHNLAR